MDAYEATRIVFSRIQSLDPENAAKIMGLLLIQDHGEKEMIRLAFGPETLLHSVILKSRKELGLPPPSPSPSPAPFLLPRHHSSSFPPSPPSWAPSPTFSRTNSNMNGAVGDDLQNQDELINPYGGDLIDELQLQEQLSFLNDPQGPSFPTHKSGGDLFYPEISGECSPYAMSWGTNGHHRKSFSAADVCLGSDATGSGIGWKPCLYYARGYCKNGTTCRFLHGLHDEVAGEKNMDAAVEQQCQELLMRSKSLRLGAAASFPYSPTATTPQSPSSFSGERISFLLQQQNESQRAAAAALMMGRTRMERNDFAGMVNPGSRQIYLTFPADSTFREEDVSNYFSIYGPVQDVRIPYQQKRMFGFVTFVYAETVKLILAKGNPHFVCDARVLVKPYKEKGKVPDKYRKQQQAERGDFSSCSTPTGLVDSRDPYDLQQLGARMLYNNTHEVLRRKLEEQQQAADLQQAIELQGRRFMGLHLLDLKTRGFPSSSSPRYINSTTTAPSDGRSSSSGGSDETPPEDKSPSPASAATTAFSQTVAAVADRLSPHGFLHQATINLTDKEESAGEKSPNQDSDFQESAKHNLPDSPFASPTKPSFAAPTEASAAHNNNNNNNNSSNNHLIASTLLPATSTLGMASFQSCFFQMPRFSSDHGAVGL